MPTTSYGFELEPGMDTDLNDVPVCCTGMVGKDRDDGGRDYTCPDCAAVVSVSATGLVDDIEEGANA